jgi:hypothetical protein
LSLANNSDHLLKLKSIQLPTGMGNFVVSIVFGTIHVPGIGTCQIKKNSDNSLISSQIAYLLTVFQMYLTSNNLKNKTVSFKILSLI